jgi:hypothetical protein
MKNRSRDMQTIQLDIADDKLNTFLTIVSNLKNDMVQNIRLQGDAQYQANRTYFHTALEEIENGNDILLNQDEYDSEMKEFIKTL